LFVYSPAVQADNLELKAARKKWVQCLSYPQALGELTKKYFTIAVSGTHGKSTTACMLGLLLLKAGFDPTVIVGTKLKEFGNSNCKVGKSQYLVIEADEHMASFLNYWPKIIILTTLEPDHLDYYKNFRNYILAFKKFLSHLPKNGRLVTNIDDKNIKKIISNRQFSIKKYSLKQSEAKKLKKLLKIPGEHNVSNALAALTLARILKIPDKTSFQALSEYKDSWRRFEICNLKIKNLKFKIISDYGHHPTEIKVTLKAAREKYPKKKIWCVYQPHQYQRTYYLFKNFVKVFRESFRPARGKALVDKLIITDIYDVAGREEKKIKEKVNSPKLVSTICRNQTSAASRVIYLAKEKILDYLKADLKGGEVVIIMGAGNIYDLTLDLTKMVKGKKIK